jgi:anti-sigma factor RsiW
MNGHSRDLLSALLDGELAPGQAADVRAHVATCGDCRRELEFVADGRRLLRALPLVDPPFGLFERMLHPRRRWARGGVGALTAGAVASVAVVALVAPREPAISPHVGRFVDTHTVSASTSGDPISELTPAAAPVSFQP